MIHQVQRENRTIKTILLCEMVKDKTTQEWGASKKGLGKMLVMLVKQQWQVSLCVAICFGVSYYLF